MNFSGGGSVWRFRPTRIQQSVSKTSAEKDPILYCPMKVGRNLIVLGYLYQSPHLLLSLLKCQLIHEDFSLTTLLKICHHHLFPNPSLHSLYLSLFLLFSPQYLSSSNRICYLYFLYNVGSIIAGFFFTALCLLHKTVSGTQQMLNMC